MEVGGFAASGTALKPSFRLGAGYRADRLSAELSGLVIPAVGEDKDLFVGVLAGLGFRFLGL